MPRKALKAAKPKSKKVKLVKVPAKAPKTPRTVKEPNPLEPFIGSLVRYYDDGWRHGYLDSVENQNSVRIRPIAAPGVAVRCHIFPNSEITVVEVKH